MTAPFFSLTSLDDNQRRRRFVPILHKRMKPFDREKAQLDAWKKTLNQNFILRNKILIAVEGVFTAIGKNSSFNYERKTLTELYDIVQKNSLTHEQELKVVRQIDDICKQIQKELKKGASPSLYVVLNSEVLLPPQYILFARTELAPYMQEFYRYLHTN